MIETPFIDELMAASRPVGELRVVGVPLEVRVLPSAAADEGLFGLFDPVRSRIFFSPGCSEREVRGMWHELLHAIDSPLRLGLSHDQVRLLALGLSTTLSNPENTLFRTHPMWCERSPS